VTNHLMGLSLRNGPGDFQRRPPPVRPTSRRILRTGLINPQLVDVPRMRPAIEAGLMVLIEAAGPYMRPVLVVFLPDKSIVGTFAVLSW
jgi:hypothetical protein